MATEEHTPDFDPFAEAPAKTPRAGNALAILALLLALGALALSGWQWWQARMSEQAGRSQVSALNQLGAQQQAGASRVAELEQRLQQLEGLKLEDGMQRLDAAVAKADGIAGSDRVRVEQIEAQQASSLARIEALESGTAALVRRGESPREAMNLSELDFLLRSANERLRLFGDARSAGEALALANTQLQALDDPVYLPVRQAVVAAQAALAATEQPDQLALSAQLDQAQARIPALAFPTAEVPAAAPEATAAEPGVWARLTGAVRGLVTVRRNTEEAGLITLEDKDFVRQGLWLQLESARLALLRSDADAYADSLLRATATLERYFDVDAGPARTLAGDLKALRAVDPTVSWPDISAPWSELQRIRTVSTMEETDAASDTLPAQQDSVPPVEEPPVTQATEGDAA